MNVIDKLYTEWAWRTKSGVPDINNPEDKAILDQILEETTNGIRSTEQVIKELQSAGVKDTYTLRSVTNTYNNYDDNKKREFNKYFRKLSLSQPDLDTIGSTYSDFYDAKASKGMGRGEVMIIMGVKNSRSGGTAEKDVLVGNKTYEVKELSGKEFSPAKDGDVNGTEYDSNFLQFKKIFTESVLEVVEEVVTDDEYTLLKNVYDYTQKNTTRNQKGSYIKAIRTSGEILKRVLNEIEEGDLHYITVRGKNIAVSADDIDKFYPGNKVDIQLGDELKDARKNINLLKKHPWVTNPGSNIKQLENILSKFFVGLNGMILFNYKGAITNPTLVSAEEARDLFYASRVTQGIVQAKLKQATSPEK